MKNRDHSRLANSDWRTHSPPPNCASPRWPIFFKINRQRKSTDSPLNAIESEYECSSSENTTSPKRTKTLFSDRQEYRRAWLFYRFAITKFFFRLVMNKRERHL